MSDEQTEDAPEKQDKKPKLPKKIKLTKPFGFWDKQGHHAWPVGMVVDNQDEIALILSRKSAFYEEV